MRPSSNAPSPVESREAWATEDAPQSPVAAPRSRADLLAARIGPSLALPSLLPTYQTAENRPKNGVHHRLPVQQEQEVLQVEQDLMEAPRVRQDAGEIRRQNPVQPQMLGRGVGMHDG